MNVLMFFLFSSTVTYFQEDPTLVTLRAFLSLCKSTNTLYEKYIKYKKPTEAIEETEAT